mgnify:CR=1 FL=1
MPMPEKIRSALVVKGRRLWHIAAVAKLSKTHVSSVLSGTYNDSRLEKVIRATALLTDHSEGWVRRQIRENPLRRPRSSSHPCLTPEQIAEMTGGKTV